MDEGLLGEEGEGGGESEEEDDDAAVVEAMKVTKDNSSVHCTSPIFLNFIICLINPCFFRCL